jgi:hypothetical protein
MICAGVLEKKHFGKFPKSAAGLVETLAMNSI